MQHTNTASIQQGGRLCTFSIGASFTYNQRRLSDTLSLLEPKWLEPEVGGGGVLPPVVVTVVTVATVATVVTVVTVVIVVL